VARTDEMMGTLTSSRNLENIVTNYTKIRKLTPVECERLQGFPDGWTDCVSDTQRYKTLGNAVTVNTVKAIVDKLLTNIN
jgi:DNA (cytosine-5)-methyltransferase 1